MHAALVLAMAIGAGRAETALEKRVSVDFRSTPFIECLEELGEKAGLAHAVDDRELDEAVLKRPVTLTLANAKAREILDLIVESVGAGYLLDGSVALVTSFEAAIRGKVVLRVHDVRDITEIVQDFPGPDFELMFAGERRRASQAIVTTEVAADVVTASSVAEMIQSRIGPDTWAAELGTSIEERGGRLVVMQTPETQEKIADLLERLAWRLKRTVAVEAVLLKLDGRPERPLARLLDERAARELMRRGRILFRTISMGFANQRRHVFSGEQMRYVADIAAGKDAHEPVVRALIDGFCLDVLPVHAEGSDRLTLDLKVAWAKLNGFREKHAGALRRDGETVSLWIQEPDFRLKSVQTSVCVPLGTWAVMEMAGERGTVVLVKAAPREDA